MILQPTSSPDLSHFIFEINVGIKRIRQRTTLQLNFLIDSKLTEDKVTYTQSRSGSDPPNSDIDFKNKMSSLQTMAIIKSLTYCCRQHQTNMSRLNSVEYTNLENIKDI